MISTFAQVKTRVLALLDDPTQQTFKDAIVLEGLGEAIDALYSAFVQFQIPRAKVISTYILPPNTQSLTPATAGIADMGEIIHLEERAAGSTEKFMPVWEVDDLSQRAMGDKLKEFEWRGDTFWFIGATVSRELRFAYFSTTEQPPDFSGSTGVDGSKTFLAKYTAAVVGPRKGYDELAAAYMQQAVGPRYEQGVIGGELFRLCQPMVRSMQRVQIAPHPFSAAGRLRIRRAVPYVAVQAGTTGGTSGGGSSMPPTQFSTADGTVTGTLDGINDTFNIPQAVSAIEVYRNGVRMTIGYDVTWAGPSATFRFAVGQIPISGDVITVDGWIA